MKLAKIIDKAERYINTDERKRKEKRKCLKHVLKKIRRYEKQLEQELENEQDIDKHKRIKKRIKLAHAQRKKGLAMMDQLKKKQKKGNAKEK
ncbi:hypothetical protein [Solemya elarraichensis gill symbiont]|uniref:Uncharacterized protein n=1 Tax=Solemya elarraichensis gill symbiont TaxID=1918949 RepID=A0A1T2L617_9GAMM|nr:hypothetical protein [Solemya elarraichensis gill symbiont]OOZ40547.1 hypothetical protein BOW52_05735 [Solemya elarraichensis gill symbiont]